MILVAPRVADEAFGRCNLLLFDIGMETEDGLFEACSLLRDTALRFHFVFYFTCQLDRFRHGWQHKFLSAPGTESSFVSLLHRFANDRTIQQVTLATSHWFVALDSQIASSQKAFE